MNTVEPSLNKQILSLAIPALGALIAEPLFVIIDSAMVGHLGRTELAGLSLASTILTTIVGLCVFLAYATTATTARLAGAGRTREALRAGIDGIWLALSLGVVLATGAWLSANWLVHALGATTDVATNAVAYLQASAPGLPGMLTVLAATGTLRGLLDTRSPFIVATIGAGVNAGLNAFLIYGLHLGVAGSGYGTALTQTLMAVVLCGLVANGAHHHEVSIHPHRSGLGNAIVAGTPLLIRTVSLRIAMMTTVWAATALGATALAAHQVVNSIWGFTAFALDALAIAAQALIGTHLGKKDAHEAKLSENDVLNGQSSRSAAAQLVTEEDTSFPSFDPHQPTTPHSQPPNIDALLRRFVMWGLGAGIALGLILALFSSLLPRVFTPNNDVAHVASVSLLIIAVLMPLAGIVFLFDGLLIGAGDGHYLAIAGVITLIPYLPIAIWIGLHPASTPAMSLGLLWLAFAGVFMGMRALTTGLRVRADAWR
ncbi:MATE family efflux transporter [Actinomyces vulturis]|uniref:MATE family efflux transporter n=1 Tax=Actinomyces vulturis TaxID=1857645 RepID=UPI001FDEF277|nr:MATE family efflux transporter [Actinomyces vulturis]